MKATLVTALISIFASTAMADSLVTCKTVSKTPVTVLEYLVKDTASKRLNSPIIVSQSLAGAQVINQSSVAQHKYTSTDLYLLSDDGNESRALELLAVNVKGTYVGAFTEFNLSGGVAKRTAVTCTATAL